MNEWRQVERGDIDRSLVDQMVPVLGIDRWDYFVITGTHTPHYNELIELVDEMRHEVG